MPHVLAISGSPRAASSATAVMEALIGRIGGRATVTRADIGAVPHHNADRDRGAGAKAFIDAVGAADGVRAQAAIKQVTTAVLAEVHRCSEVVVPQAVARTVAGRFADQTTLDFTAPHLDAWLAKLG
jgi:chromate reductase